MFDRSLSLAAQKLLVIDLIVLADQMKKGLKLRDLAGPKGTAVNP